MRESYHTQYLIAERRRRERNKRIKIALAVVLVCVVGAAAFMVANSKGGNVEAGDEATANETFDETPGSKLAENSQQSDNIVITLFGDANTRVLKGEEYIESSCHAADTAAQCNLDNISISGQVDTSKTGDYEITYTATNDSGQYNTATRKVSVVDSFDGGAAQSVSVCMYHYVYDESNKPAEIDNNWMEASLLRQHVQYTKDNNFYYPSYEELKAFVEGKKTLPAKSVIFTFDDAMSQFLQSGVPIFDELEVPATSFVICNDDDAKEKIFSHASKFVQYQSHSYAMHQGGSGVGKGGIIHASTYDEILADQKKAVEIVGNGQAFAYPFGDNNDTAKQALSAAGVEVAFTVENRQIVKGDDLLALPRVRINGTYTLEQFAWSVS